MNTFLLHHLLSESSLKEPDSPAVISGSRSITYAELETMSNRLSVSLVRMGVKKGDRVGILLGKSTESIISLFGIMKAGAIYVPLDPQAPAGRLNHIVSHCGIECLITSQKGLEKLYSDSDAGLPVRKVILAGVQPHDCTDKGRNIECIAWETTVAASADSYSPVTLSDTSPAYILHTSGSTGMPKGVVISHLNALTFVNMAADVFEIGRRDRVASHAPLHFDLSVFDIFGAIKSGAAIILVPELLSVFPAKLAEFIDREQISIWNSVSSVLTMLADKGSLDRFRFDKLRLIHFSGDVMPVKYLRKLKKHMEKAAFFNIYGQTEANSSLCYPVREVPDKDAWKIPIGKPFPNFEVFALNEQGAAITQPGEEGELFVSGSTVALGYWNDEKRSQERFVIDPRRPSLGTRVYKTGDLVRIDGEGNYLFAGRNDHMVKSRGFRIELGEIEIALNGFPAVRHAVALAIPDEIIGNRIIAFVESRTGKDIADRELYDYCSKSLPPYMLPEKIVYVNAMPKTTTGKIDRKQIEQSFLQP
jgi:amino acid adenylation domain-containing protein